MPVMRDIGADTVALDTWVTRLDVPVVTITAERKPDHAVRRSHERLVERLGGRLLTPPGAAHPPLPRRS